MSTSLVPRPRSDGRATSGSDASRRAARRPTGGEGDATDRSADPGLPSHLISLPILILYPHSRCNCRCTMCDIWRPGPKDELAVGWVRREAPAWRELGVRRVVLSGGEPLMHSDLCAFVEPLVACGLGITLLSTGLLLKKHAAWVAALCDEVIVSLDGPPELHAAVRRVPRAFERLAEGVGALRAEAVVPRIAARCTLQRANVHALRATVEAARSLGLDGISFLAVDAHSEAFNRPGGPSAEALTSLLPNSAQIEGLRQDIEALMRSNAADFAEGFIAESPAKLRRLADYFAACRGDGDYPTVRCNAPWVSAVVEADGLVRPCFFHRSVGRWEGGAGLGTIINGPAAVSFRDQLNVASNDTCRRCVCSLNLETAARTPML